MIHQLGMMAAELSQLQFSKIGYLYKDGDNTYTVRGFCRRVIRVVKEIRLPSTRDPFNDEGAYYESLVSANRVHAQELQVGGELLYCSAPCAK